jgi:hypothetical protein
MKAKTKVEIFITSAKRASWCLNLLKELQNETDLKSIDYNCRVFHDFCLSDDYSQVQEFCSQHDNYFYYRTKENLGKYGFWKLNNLMYCFLDTLKFDVYIQLVDDITLVKDFTKRAVKVLTPNIDIVNPGLVNIHEFTKTFTHCKMVAAKGVELIQTNWVDCCFIAKEKAIRGLQIEEPPPHRKRDVNLGSGVAQMFVKAYNQKSGKKAWQLRYALFEHLGAELTAMHFPDRKECYYGNYKTGKDPLRMLMTAKDKEYTDPKFDKLTKHTKSMESNKNTVDVFIASLPQRRFLNNTVKSLLEQPQVANIFCYLNNYTKEDTLQLIKHPKVHYIHRRNTKGCTERFWNIAKYAVSKYLAFADDDFTVCENYFAPLIEAAEKYKALVSYHGCNLHPAPRKNYYKDRTVFHCRRLVKEDVKVDIIGCGASLVERSLLNGLHTFYNRAKHGNMDDIYYSALAEANGVSRYVVAHDDKTIFEKPAEPTDDYIFDRLRNDCKPQTDFVNKYFV